MGLGNLSADLMNFEKVARGQVAGLGARRGRGRVNSHDKSPLSRVGFGGPPGRTSRLPSAPLPLRRPGEGWSTSASPPSAGSPNWPSSAFVRLHYIPDIIVTSRLDPRGKAYKGSSNAGKHDVEQPLCLRHSVREKGRPRLDEPNWAHWLARRRRCFAVDLFDNNSTRLPRKQERYGK